METFQCAACRLILAMSTQGLAEPVALCTPCMRRRHFPSATKTKEVAANDPHVLLGAYALRHSVSPLEAAAQSVEQFTEDKGLENVGTHVRSWARLPGSDLTLRISKMDGSGELTLFRQKLPGLDISGGDAASGTAAPVVLPDRIAFCLASEDPAPPTKRKLQDFFRALGARTELDYVLENDPPNPEHCFSYRLPGPSTKLGELCSYVLTDAFNVGPEEALRFTLMTVKPARAVGATDAASSEPEREGGRRMS